MKFGVYRCLNPARAELRAIETTLDARLDIFSCYRAWGRCNIDNDRAWLAGLRASDTEILLTWEPWALPAPGEERPWAQPAFSLAAIASGRYERYILDFAVELRRFTRTVYLRPMHEMNGNWYPWCGTVNGNNPRDYVAAWRHLRALFARAGATNVQWVWCPYAASYPPETANAMTAYFPGDADADWVGLDAYNWGDSRPWSCWQPFAELVEPAYAILSRLSRRPIMFAEIGCAASGGDKAAWIQAMFRGLRKRYRRAQALVWFDENKECDWRIASSPEALTAFRAGARRLAVNRSAA